jgi:zinc transport system substrate-binding protein
MRHLIYIILFSTVLFSCSKNNTAEITFSVSIHPVASIIKEITGDSGIITLLKPGASPHTYSPTPSDIQAASKSKALFYVSESIDGWAANLNVENRISLLAMLPDSMKVFFEGEHGLHSSHGEDCEHSEGSLDPHFWTSPAAVKAIVPKLTEALIELIPEKKEIYTRNAERFIERLDSLDAELKITLSDIKGKTVFLFHPSFCYLIERYGLNYGGSIEISPGKEPSPKYLADLSRRIAESSTKSLFSEPQIPINSAKALADELSVGLYELDPIGDDELSYFDLIKKNAEILKTAMK